MSTTTTHPILIGTSGWSYPEWDGAFYPPGMDPADYLSWYADRFPIVEVDSTFYRVPTRRMVQGWRNHTPPGFRFALKVPQVITHKKQLHDCEREVEDLVGAIGPLGEKLSCALLQLGYFNREQFPSLDAFLEVLDPFLGSWPHEAVPLALETRNPRWVGPELAGVLRRHQTALTLTLQKWMPHPSEILSRIDAVTGPLSYIRLIGNREATEKLTTTLNRIVLDKSEELAECARSMEELARRVPVIAFTNNHYAGYAPETGRDLQRRLGIPEMVPPPRPRTTLFD
jgi:uncharacterized protein YecE (DUF72 family)